MANDGGTGFLSGFVQTSLALHQQQQQDRQLEEQSVARKEQLKLQKQQLEGQQASQTLQRLELQGKIKKQAELDQLSAQLGTLFNNGEAATPENEQLIRGKVAEYLLKAGNPEVVQKMMAHLDEQKQVRDFQREMQGRGATALPGMSGQAPRVTAPPLDQGFPEVIPNTDPSQPATLRYPQQVAVPPLPASAETESVRQAIVAEAQRQGVDPTLALAIAHVESGFRNVPGDGGKAQGYFQLHAPAAQDAGIDPAQRSDPAQNIQAGVTYIKQKLAQAGGDVNKALLLYNGGGDPNYVAKVHQALGQQGAVGGAMPTAEAPTFTTPRLQEKEQERQRLEQTLNALTLARQRYPALEKTINAQLDDTRAQLKLVDDQVKNERELALPKNFDEADRLAYEMFRKPGFRFLSPEQAGLVNAKLRSQKLEDKFEGEPLTDEPSRVAKELFNLPVRKLNAEQTGLLNETIRLNKAEQDRLDSLARLPQELQKAEKGKAATPISDTAVRSITDNTIIHDQIGKVEQILAKVERLPANFLTQVQADSPTIQKALADPKSDLVGLFNQFGTKWRSASGGDPEAARFLSSLGTLRDLIIRERSGASVTGNELARSTGAFFGSLPNISQSLPLFAENLGVIKASVERQLAIQGATIRPLAGGEVVFKLLPQSVRQQIDGVDTVPLQPTATPSVAPVATRPTSAPSINSMLPTQGAGVVPPALTSGVPKEGFLGVQDLGNGKIATVLNQTVTDPRLNGGRPTNIPLIVPGISLAEIKAIAAGGKPSQAAYDRSVLHAVARTANGEAIPSYDTIEQAVEIAKQESEDRGRANAPSQTPTPAVKSIPPYIQKLPPLLQQQWRPPSAN